jgi:predicted phosphoribosyltransferase
MLHDRVQAASLLAERLTAYKNTDAVVLAIPSGGFVVAYHLAKSLNLHLDVIPCGKIKHPSGQADIGSVSLDEVIITDSSRDLPQDYIHHQVVLLQHALQAKDKFYRGDRPPENLMGKTVILVDDLLLSSHTILACLKTIDKQQPDKIIVAVPVIAQVVHREIAPAVDDLVFLMMENESVYENFDAVEEEEVKSLLRIFNK